MSRNKKKIAIIGGGISGLSLGYRLKKAGAEVVLFESGDSPGGNIITASRDGFILEFGPNTVLANRELLEMINDLGLTGKIAQTRPNAKKRFILMNQKLNALPTGPMGLFGNAIITPGVLLRVLKEPLINSTSPKNESVGAFFERRLGREIVDRAVDPFISGIYAGDPWKLSIRHAFPSLFKYEEDFGSLIKGAFFSPKDKAARLPKGSPRTINFAKGLQTLTDAIGEYLGDSICPGTAVLAVNGDGKGPYTVRTQAGMEEFSAIALCTPSHAAGIMLESLDEELSAQLSNIYYPPVSVVFSAYRKENVRSNVDGFGFLVPSMEKRKILGSLWTSSIFEGRAPEGCHLFTTFIGGSRNPDLCNMDEAALIRLAGEELGNILGIDAEPIFTLAKKWEKAIPQYNIGYENVLNAISRFRDSYPGVFFCSNFYKGVSVGDCVRNAFMTSAEMLS